MNEVCRHCDGPLDDETEIGVCTACQFAALAARGGFYDPSGQAARRQRDAQAVAEGRAITCPVCEMTSYHPNDVAEGYCGNCHDWTGQPRPGPHATIWRVP